MTPVDAVYYATQHIPDDLPPIEMFDEAGRAFAPRQVWPAYHAACAYVSGCLESATTPDELRESIEHGQSLHNSGIVSDDEISFVAGAFRLAMLAWRELHAAEIATPEVQTEMQRREIARERAGARYDDWGLAGQSLN